MIGSLRNAATTVETKMEELAKPYTISSGLKDGRATLDNGGDEEGAAFIHMKLAFV